VCRFPVQLVGVVWRKNCDKFIKMLNLKKVKCNNGYSASKMASNCAGTGQMSEESESWIRK